MGMDTRFTFSGGGELDNGMTASFYVVDEINAGDNSFYSGEVALGMGDLGTISLNQGAGNVGADAIDDETPRAYEEADDQLSTSFRGLANPQGSGNLIKYTNSLGMVNVNLGFRSGSGSNNAVGNTGGTNEGNVYTGALTSSPIDGLTVGASYIEFSGSGSANTVQEPQSGSYMATYASGPFSVGYSKGFKAPIVGSLTAGAAVETVDYYDQTNMSIAYAATDDLSISYEKETSEANYVLNTTADVEQKSTSLQVAYTMGGMTIALAQADHENVGYSTATTADREQTLIAVTMAF
jgi:hypothetical protein